VLFAFRELLHARTDELARIVTAEHGKVLSDAVGEISRGLENSPPEFRIFSRAATPNRPRPGWTCTRSVSPSGWSPGSRRSTSR
jgi:malonate-semialdehyde dehydrogenase (acetylating)/methylmalonate-semialdehyde dehydrogenase